MEVLLGVDVLVAGSSIEVFVVKAFQLFNVVAPNRDVFNFNHLSESSKLSERWDGLSDPQNNFSKLVTIFHARHCFIDFFQGINFINDRLNFSTLDEVEHR